MDQQVGRMLVLVAVIACDPIRVDDPTQVSLDDAVEVFERELCERMFDCECAQGRYFESVEACVERVQNEVAELREQPPIAGVAYDPYCLGERVDELDALGCGTQVELPDECERPCRPWHGEVNEGEPCKATSDGRTTDCTRRLFCNIDTCGYDPASGTEICSGVCRDPCERSPEPGCDIVCGEDSYCDEDAGSCKALPGPGDACAQGFRCLPPAWCGPDPDDPAASICIALGELDEPCTGHTQCASGYCPAGRCAPLPKAGESCAGTFACADGLQCDGTTLECVRADAAVCTMPPGLR